MKWWRWAVVSAVEVSVCNMPPSMPGEPPPPGFKVAQRLSVKVHSRHRSLRVAERWAPATRDGLEDVGQVMSAAGVQVWSRERVERECQEWKVTVCR